MKESMKMNHPLPLRPVLAAASDIPNVIRPRDPFRRVLTSAAFSLAVLGFIRPAAVQATPWTPADLLQPPALWLDASDLSASPVSQWNDKSPNGRNFAQATGANQPAYSATSFNTSYPGVTFDGSNDFMSAGDTLDLGTQSLGIIAAVKYNTNNTSGMVISKTRYAAGSGRYFMGRFQGTGFGLGSGTQYQYVGESDFKTAISPADSSTSPRLLGFDLNRQTSGYIKNWIDAVAVKTETFTGNATNYNSTDLLLLGAYGNSTGTGPQANSYLSGVIAEVVVVQTAMSDADRWKLEGYLAWKWGIQANLPADHPYKSAAPVNDTTPPTLTSIVDDKSGGPVLQGTLVTYTVTFSEDMDASTVSAADFGNAGSAAVTIGAVTETAPFSGVFTVQVTPSTTGTLQLQVNAGADLRDAAGNALVTTSALLDDTTITVEPTPGNTGAGGTITYTDSNGLNPAATPYSGGYVVHTFTSSGTLNVPVALSADVLVVGGGGGGGQTAGGGGGAGGYIYNTAYAITAGSGYAVTVGNGGTGAAGGVWPSYGSGNGGQGNNSVLGTLTAIGGGGGGNWGGAGVAGGSGGGHGTSILDSTGAAGTSGQGKAGGKSQNTSGNARYGGGGGGGVQLVGGSATTGKAAGAGGDGLANAISGNNVVYAGGGGGGARSDETGSSAGLGGAGGGGGGGRSTVGTNGVANTGGGGGGGGYAGTDPGLSGGNGGSGIVIVRYPYAIPGAPPTLASIVDDKSGGPIAPNTQVTYTVTFNGDMDDSTVSAADFGNAGSASFTIGTVTEITAGVFTVPVTPTGGGTLRLQINAGAELKNVDGNALDTTSALLDDTTITVDVTPPTLVGIVDSVSGGPAERNALVTYTVTFSEDMDAGTVSAADFGNAGSAAVTIGTVTETTPTSGVFTVQVTPTTTGTLQLQINAGADLRDVVGNALDTTSALLDDTTLTVNDTIPPTLVNIVDDNGGGTIAANTLVTYTVTFSEAMDAGTVDAADFGNAGSAAVTVGTVTATTPSVFTVQVTPTSGGSLRLQVNAGAELKDVAGNALVTTSALLDDTTITVDVTPPTVATLSPADGATYVATGLNFAATFDEAIAVGTGNITLRNLTDNTETTIDLTDGSQVSVAGTVLTINPTADLTAGKDYAIRIDATAIKDLYGNYFAGIADDTTWNFATAAANTWTPWQLPDLALWLDASDAGTIALSGSTVSQWIDKSGNNRHVTQATATKRPRYVNNLPNGPALSFDGADDSLFASAATITLSQPVHRFIACKFLTKTSRSVVCDSDMYASPFFFYNGEAGGTTAGKWSFNAGANNISYGTADTSNNHIHYNLVNDTASYYSIDGATTPSGPVNVGANTLHGLRIGNIRTEFHPDYAFQGYVYEVVLVQGTLSTADRQNVEGYLAWKWGTQASLPADHPYKSAPPIVGTGAPEIAAEHPAGTNIPSGGSHDFGTVTLGSNISLTFTIKNKGTVDLNLTGTPQVDITGANESDFTVTAQPATPVTAGGGTTTFTVQFAPGGAGARNAALSIANDDTTGGENPFVINLSGTGQAQQTPYQAWANGANFNDPNSEGIAYGMAWMLGAGTSTSPSVGLLPAALPGSGLIMHFKRVHDQGSAQLYFQYSSDLGTWPDPGLLIPDNQYGTGIGLATGITATITEGDPDDVTVTVVPADHEADGKLFGRLKASEN